MPSHVTRVDLFIALIFFHHLLIFTMLTLFVPTILLNFSALLCPLSPINFQIHLWLEKRGFQPFWLKKHLAHASFSNELTITSLSKTDPRYQRPLSTTPCISGIYGIHPRPISMFHSCCQRLQKKVFSNSHALHEQRAFNII